MSWQPTKIERFEVKHPGLEKEVCTWLKSYVPGHEIARRLRAQYNEAISPKAINNYMSRRLKRQEERVQKQKESYLGFMEAVGEKGLDAGAAAKLWEALQSMTPAELIALRRVQLERERVGVLNKRAENEKEKLKATLAQLKKEGQQAKGGADSEPRPDPLEIRRRIRAIFGLPDDRAEFENKGQIPAQALEGSVTGMHGSNQQPAEQDENKSEVQGPKSDDPKCAGPRTSDSGLSSDGPPASDD